MSGYPRPGRTAAVALREVAQAAGAPASDVDVDVAVTGATHDSALVRPGDLYAAVRGSRHHGADFTAAAVAAGAVAVLTDPDGAARSQAGAPGRPVLVVADARAALGPAADAAYGQPTARLPVIGLTGTAGKTTTAYLVDSALRAAGHRTCLVGTVQTTIGDLVVESVRTTPEATDLHGLFAAALEQGVSAAVIEVSSHALAYGRVGGVRFAVGGWTNFGLDHLDFHADAAEYFETKARLFDGRCRAEILNVDDPAVASLLQPGRIGFSAAGAPTADWRATDVVADGFGQRFRAHGPGGVSVAARVALPGRHNVANALLAIACATQLGADPAIAADGVAACPGVPGRLELVTAPGPVRGVVDYAHKPDAIVAALAALREVGGGRLIVVIGAGGDRDTLKRPLMGAAAATGADVVVVTDDNPRTEDPALIRAQVRAGAESARAARVLELAGRRAAIAAAVGLAEPGDVVALLGKGHERGQEVEGITSAFDDRVELAAALSERFAGVSA